MCKAVMGTKQKAQLRRMVDFKFTRHPSLNLPEERLTAIEKQLGEHTRELFSIPVQRSLKRKNEQKIIRLRLSEQSHTADTISAAHTDGYKIPVKITTYVPKTTTYREPIEIGS
ncbi:MAG: hypothetical protein V8S96_06780 [Lachnospiraceae bacterium]